MKGPMLIAALGLLAAGCGRDGDGARPATRASAAPTAAAAPAGAAAGPTFDLAAEVVAKDPAARTLTLRERGSDLTRVVSVEGPAAEGLPDVEESEIIRVQCRGQAPATAAGALQACQSIVALSPSAP